MTLQRSKIDVIAFWLSLNSQNLLSNKESIPDAVGYCPCVIGIMADKEATVYIVDLGASMGKVHNGREVSDLDWAMTYVWDKVTSTVCIPLSRLRPHIDKFRWLLTGRLLLSVFLAYAQMVSVMLFTSTSKFDQWKLPRTKWAMRKAFIISPYCRRSASIRHDDILSIYC